MIGTKRLSPLCAALALTAGFLVSSCERIIIAQEDERLETSNDQSSVLKAYAVLPPGHGVSVIEEQDRSDDCFRTDLERFDNLKTVVGNSEPFNINNFFRDISLSTPISATEEITLPAGGSGLRIAREKSTNIPLVYGDTRLEAMFGIGYAHARDRLWQQDVLRNKYRSSLATLLGAGEQNTNIESDAFWFGRLGYLEEDYQGMLDDLLTEHGPWGKQAYKDIEAYTRGVNAYIDQFAKDPSGVPLEYRERGLFPARWRMTDNVALTAGLNATRGFGVREWGNSRLLQQLRTRFGPSLGDKVYNDFRLADDPEAPAVIPGTAQPWSWDHGFNPIHHVLLDKDSFIPFDPLGETTEIDSKTPHSGDENRPNKIVEDPTSLPAALRSNALLISGAHTQSGHPISAQGPQDQFGTPHSENMEIRVVSPEMTFRGVLEFRSPYPVNGMVTDRYATSSTSQRSDQFDSFVLELCNPDGGNVELDADHYLLEGECTAFDARRVTRTLPSSDTSYVLNNLRSKVGRIVGRATVDGVPVAIAQASIYLDNEAADFPVYAQVVTKGEVESAEDFVRIMKQGQLSVIFYYIDDESIAAVELGDLPDRKVSGDFPLKDIESWSWEDRSQNTWRPALVARSNKPSTIDPPQGFIAGWNNLPQRGWSTGEAVMGGFYFGPLNRVQLLSIPTKAAIKEAPINVEEVVRLHATAGLTDTTSYLLWPIVDEVLSKGRPSTKNSAARSAMNAWHRSGARWMSRHDEEVNSHLHTAVFAKEFWPRLYQVIYTEFFGEEIISEINYSSARIQNRRFNNMVRMDYNSSSIRLWGGLLHRDLSQLLGRHTSTTLSVPLCGNGDIQICADLIHKVMDDIYRAQPNKEDDEDILTIDFPSSGAAKPVDSIDWQNRPTFHLVVTSQ